MDKVGARPIGAVASNPILLARLSLVLGVPYNIPSQLMLSMSKLAEVAIEAGALLLEVAADLSLETGVCTLINRACCIITSSAEAMKTGCTLTKGGSKKVTSCS